MNTDETLVDLRGLWIPTVTPFTADDRVDEPALASLCERLLGDGARGLVALGTTGEPAVLSAAERAVVVAVSGDVCCRMNRPLIVGAGGNSTRATIESVRALAGLDAVVATLVVVPYYNRPSPAGVVDHFRAVAAASPVPVVAYHVPYRTGRDLGPEHLVELAHIPNVAGIKLAVGALDGDTLHLLREAPQGFQVLAGDDAFIAPTILMGGAGALAASAHVCTPAFAALVAAALAGDVPTARTLAQQLLPVVEAGFAEPSPAVWKGGLRDRGELATAALRPPMTEASAAATARLGLAVAAVEPSRGGRMSGWPTACSARS